MYQDVSGPSFSNSLVSPSVFILFYLLTCVCEGRFSMNLLFYAAVQDVRLRKVLHLEKYFFLYLLDVFCAFKSLRSL